MPIPKFKESYLLSATVTKWQTNKRDGWKRIKTSTGTTYLLNTNRFDGMRDMTGGTSCSCYYFDNPYDNRNNSGYMELTKTVAQIKTEGNKTPTHYYMTLPLYPATKNDTFDTTQSTTDKTIPIADFAFAVDVGDAYAGTHSFIWYSEGGNKFIKGRVALSLAQLLALIV